MFFKDLPIKLPILKNLKIKHLNLLITKIYKTQKLLFF